MSWNKENNDWKDDEQQDWKPESQDNDSTQQYNELKEQFAKLRAQYLILYTTYQHEHTWVILMEQLVTTQKVLIQKTIEHIKKESQTTKLLKRQIKRLLSQIKFVSFN